MIEEMKSKVSERRLTPRWQIERSFLYKILAEKMDLSIGFLQDINLVGAKVYLQTQVALSAKIRLLIRLPQQTAPIITEGEVIWQNPSVPRAKKFPTGICFTFFKPQDKERVLHYFAQQIRENWWRQRPAE